MTSFQDVQAWRDKKMIDADGDKIGSIEEIYLDRQTGEPEWAAVKTGLFGTKLSFVPIRDAEMTAGGDVRVPFQKEQVKDAPRIEADGELSEEEERRLYEHYGRSDYADWQGEDRTTALGLPDEGDRRFARVRDVPGTGDAGGPGGPGGDAEEPAVVGVRLRRVVVVASEPGDRAP
jgi:sporulation protein YlmC with PRC-barrel domain